MRADGDAMLLVRADLCERLGAMRELAGRQSAGDFAAALVGIRQLAGAYGLVPVVQLAEAIERAAARGDIGQASRALYFDRLQDAIGCTRLDEAAGQAMIASVSVRFGG